MQLTKYFEWMNSADPSSRAQGGAAIARAFLFGNLEPQQRDLLHTAMINLATDASPLVRRALAEQLADAKDVPLPILRMLAHDQEEVARPILLHSTLLDETELIDIARNGDSKIKSILSLRTVVSSGLCSVLAEAADAPALISLCLNGGAQITHSAMIVMIKRHSDNKQLIDAILSIDNKSLSVKASAVVATSRWLSQICVKNGWLTHDRAELIENQECERGLVTIAQNLEKKKSGETRLLAAHLHQSNLLTPSLLILALISGGNSLFEAAIVEISGLTMNKVKSIIEGFRNSSFAAMIRQIELPAHYISIFRAIFEGQEEGLRVNRICHKALVVIKALSESVVSEDIPAIAAMLRRLETEALKNGARESLSALASWEASAISK